MFGNKIYDEMESKIEETFIEIKRTPKDSDAMINQLKAFVKERAVNDVVETAKDA